MNLSQAMSMHRRFEATYPDVKAPFRWLGGPRGYAVAVKFRGESRDITDPNGEGEIHNMLARQGIKPVRAVVEAGHE